jgi:hypothetical protein
MCSKDKPLRYEAVYTPSDSGQEQRLVICEDCGRAMDAETFAQLAMANLPKDGRVDLVNHPDDQVERDGKMPENQ